MSDNFVIDGSGTAYRLYDVGYEITLAQTQELLAPVAARPRPRRSEAGAILTPTPPLPVELGRERLQLDGADYGGAVSASIYDFGVVALRLQVPADPQLPWTRFANFGSALDAFASETPIFDRYLSALLTRIRPTVTRPRIATVTEEFIVFRVAEFKTPAGATCRPSDIADDALVSLLLNETRPLSRHAKRELLPHRFSYTAADFTVLTWDNALVVEPAADDHDIEYVLEFANAQLLELRVFDAMLDAELPKMYHRVAAARAAPHLLLRGRFRPLLSDLQTLVADTTEIVERVENALKVTDDVYLARIYSATLQIFRGRAWRRGIDRKLGIIRETYAMLNAESQTVRGEVLELAVILLIVGEILLSLFGRR